MRQLQLSAACILHLFCTTASEYAVLVLRHKQGAYIWKERAGRAASYAVRLLASTSSTCDHKGRYLQPAGRSARWNARGACKLWCSNASYMLY
jgi:hypothetical protein